MKPIPKEQKPGKVPGNDYSKRVSTGMPSLDNNMEGGFPVGGSSILFGSPGTCKSIFCQQFVNKSLEDGKAVIYITSSESPARVLGKMSRFGWNLKDRIEKDLIFVDFYSWRLGKTTVPETKFVLKDPNSVEDIKACITGALKNVKKREPDVCVVFDSVSALMMYSDDSERLLAFVAGLSARIREGMSVGLFVLEEAVQDPTTVAFIDTMVDGVLQFAVHENDRLVRISRMAATGHSRDWYKFEITPKGLQLIEKKYIPEPAISEYIR